MNIVEQIQGWRDEAEAVIETQKETARGNPLNERDIGYADGYSAGLTKVLAAMPEVLAKMEGWMHEGEWAGDLHSDTAEIFTIWPEQHTPAHKPVHLTITKREAI